MHRTPAPPALRRLAAPAAVATTAVAVCCLVVWADPTTPGGPIPVCPTKALLGIDCPLCGGSRMLHSLLHLDVPEALHYNAVGVVAFVLVFASYLTWTWGRLRGRRVRGWHDLRRAPAFTLAVLGGWFVVRNLPFEPFTGLRV